MLHPKMRERKLNIKIDSIKRNFVTMSNSENWTDPDNFTDEISKYQNALQAAENFNIDNLEESISELQKYWFPTATIFETHLDEFIAFLRKHYN